MKTLVVGSAIIDMVMQVDKIPQSGEDVLGKDVKTMVGGCAYNVASTLKNLGCEHDLCVPVGTGMYADIIRKELEKNGYKVLIHEKEKDNGFCLCLVEKDGERTFVTMQGIEGDFKLNWFKNLKINEYQNIYLSGYQVCGRNGDVVVEWLSRLKGKDIYFAPGPVICDIERNTMKRILALHPILHLNEKELFDYTNKNTIEDALKNLYGMSNNKIIVTLGSEGAIYYDGNILKISSIKAHVVDTIGAGDSHIGAILGGISKGMNMEQSIKMANRIAASIVGIQGAIMSQEQFKTNEENYYE